MSEINYFDLNKKSWNNRVDIHYDSEFYDVKNFIAGNTSLNDIELNLLGNLKNKSVLHLQCHFGQDTISLSRLGAIATGVDFSENAINKANILAKETNSSAEFICCNIYDLPKHLDKKFDIVFTSYGTITWLPDLKQWAKLICDYLKPNGKFVFAEFHPVVWMFDDYFKTVAYNYFNTGPIVETENGTYADPEAPISSEYIGWNHSIGEVLNNLISNGLEINSFTEFDYSPYNCFKETIETEPKKYRIKHLHNNIPMVYALAATKK